MVVDQHTRVPAHAPAIDGRARVAVRAVSPRIECGWFAIKRTVGEAVTVEAEAFADGHDLVACALLHRFEGETDWRESPMEPLHNDRWRGRFVPGALGRCEYAVSAWVDRFGTWRRDLAKRMGAGQDVGTDFEIGARLVEAAAERASRPDDTDGADARVLRAAARLFRSVAPLAQRAAGAADPALGALMRRHAERAHATTSEPLGVIVDPERAGFSAWYELFPRSCGAEAGRHGTFRDVIARLPAIAEMGFDVLYLPPIHPIGRAFRKGPNNAPVAGPDDVGSPWGIGSEEGGHDAVHPQLGTLADFDALVAAAGAQGIDIALDLALQCSPDHPWVREHPEWFRHRPDGTIQYAENPPKKYQDIYPLDFECVAWESLWAEIRRVVDFWIARGVRIFRVDNPHTKPFAMWEWLIGGVKHEHPGAIFLAEAFTRPAVMYELARLGFTQSYTYFTWRNTKHDLEAYFAELTATEVREYFRPNLWPNTPDILNEYLQTGGRAAFIVRLVLAATLSSNYGIYGPAFELCAATPREPGSEEYLDSEKYQLVRWGEGGSDRPDSLAPLISLVNRIRRENPALRGNSTLRFHRIDDDEMICYSKTTDDGDNTIICVVNLDPRRERWARVHLDLGALGIDPARPYQVHDLLGGGRYVWQGPANHVGLSPHGAPAHIFRVRRHVRTEEQFEYYL